MFIPLIMKMIDANTLSALAPDEITKLNQFLQGEAVPWIVEIENSRNYLDI